MKLTIDGLSKSYNHTVKADSIKALNKLSLTIGSGMFGLLGPNGAGKSTLMRILATLQMPDEGTIQLNDVNLLNEKHRVRSQLGYLPQEFGVYPKLSAEALLNHIAVLKGVIDKNQRKEAVAFLLQRTNLWGVRKNQLGTFSGGMKQRFGIAQALIGDPKLIIVDEPTAGLDPHERYRFLNLLAELGENAIVILSTHIVDDVKELCSRMAIINNGRLLYTGNPKDALDEFVGKIWKTSIHRSEYDQFNERYTIVSEKLNSGRKEIHVFSEGRPGDQFEPVQVDLEDVYFSLILRSNPEVSTPHV